MVMRAPSLGYLRRAGALFVAVFFAGALPPAFFAVAFFAVAFAVVVFAVAVFARAAVCDLGT